MKLVFKLNDGRNIEGNFSKSAITIGRTNKSDFVVHDEALSRLHCKIEIENGEFFITDLSSTNGVYLNGIRISSDVRTPFNTFMQISIGPYECTVEDDDNQSATDYVVDSHPERIQPSLETKTTIRYAPKLHKKPRRSKNIIFGLIFLAITVITYKLIFEIDDDEKVSTNPMLNLSQRASHRITTRDDFYSNDVYISLENKKSCQGAEDICKEFLISEDSGGIVTDGREVFIFLQPLPFFQIPHLSYLKDISGGDEIISHFIVLKSELMNMMERNEIDQVHLVVNHGQKKTTKVFRYHAKHLTTERRFKLIEMLSRTIRNRNIDENTHELMSIAPSKEFEKN